MKDEHDPFNFLTTDAEFKPRRIIIRVLAHVVLFTAVTLLSFSWVNVFKLRPEDLLFPLLVITGGLYVNIIYFLLGLSVFKASLLFVFEALVFWFFVKVLNAPYFNLSLEAVLWTYVFGMPIIHFIIVETLHRLELKTLKAEAGRV